MMKTAGILLAAALLASAAGVARAAVVRVPISVAGMQLSFAPEAGDLLQGRKSLTEAPLWSDSKALAFHLGDDSVIKLYTGPRYEGGFWDASQDKVNAYGRKELELIGQWAQEGLSLPVRETGKTPASDKGKKQEEGILYAVLEKPQAGVSVSNSVRKGQFAKVADHVKDLTRRLVDAGWNLGTFNPTQIYLDQTDPRSPRPLLIKAYQSDRRQEEGGDRRALPEYYDQKLRLFELMSKMYGSIKRRNAAPVSDGRHTEDRIEIAKMVFESLRTDRDMRVEFFDKDRQRKTFHIRPLENSLRKDDFMKGYIRVHLFADQGRANKEYTLRLDSILSAEFLD